MIELSKAGLNWDSNCVICSTASVAVCGKKIAPGTKPDKQSWERGSRLCSSAFLNARGHPTASSTRLGKRYVIEVAQATRMKTDKRWVFARMLRQEVKGKALKDVLAGNIANSVNKTPSPKANALGIVKQPSLFGPLHNFVCKCLVNEVLPRYLIWIDVWQIICLVTGASMGQRVHIGPCLIIMRAQLNSTVMSLPDYTQAVNRHHWSSLIAKG